MGGAVKNAEEVYSVARNAMKEAVLWRYYEEGGTLREERDIVETLAVVLVREVITNGTRGGGEPTELFKGGE